ncbi:hypothetical protein [Streptomyces fradiae]|uniref:hypothetical protein n=1 Tax=Streptomyces fradiae TaxID=1906 RepID=UPI0036F69B76
MAHLAMRTNAGGVAAAKTPSPSRLASAPLRVLLAESGARIVDTSITDDAFLGAVMRHRSGPISIVLPSGRSAVERDTMVRYLIGKILSSKTPTGPAGDTKPGALS